MSQVDLPHLATDKMNAISKSFGETSKVKESKIIRSRKEQMTSDCKDYNKLVK
jgi:hypothetical protein